MADTNSGAREIAWKDHKPIHFLSIYQPEKSHNGKQACGDWLTQLTMPQLVDEYTS